MVPLSVKLGRFELITFCVDPMQLKWAMAARMVLRLSRITESQANSVSLPHS
jgi:hypothetical protein